MTMSLKIKGAYAMANRRIDKTFDVDVKIVDFGFSYRTKRLTFINKESNETLAEISVNHPEHYPATAENWVDILTNNISILKDKSIPIFSKNTVEYKRVTTQPNTGRHFFRFHAPGKDLILLVEHPRGVHYYSEGLNKIPVVEWKEKVPGLSTGGVYVTNHCIGIRLIRTQEDCKYTDEYSFIKFKEKLSFEEEMDLYLKHRLPHTTNLDLLSFEMKHLNQHGFVGKQIKDFTYFESPLGFGFTFEENPDVKIIQTIHSILLERGNRLDHEKYVQLTLSIEPSLAGIPNKSELISSSLNFYKSLNID